MANVIVDKNKIDLLANAISAKSGEALTLTLDEMIDAVDGISEGGGGVTPTGTITITTNGTADVTNYAIADVQVPSPTGNINITTAGTTDVTNYATATVPSVGVWESVLTRNNYTTINGNRYWKPQVGIQVFSGEDGWIEAGTYSETDTLNAVASGTSVTPTESAQTIGGANTMMEGAVTVNAISSDYVGSAIDRYDSSDLTVSGATVSGSGGYYANAFSKSVASGTAGTPTATKGSVSNHSVSVTPSVTNTTGYITGSTKTGTAVSVSASELVSGTYTASASGTSDITNYATLSVPSGTAGTPSATKSAVSNHAVTVTPSVTNSTGWITGSTKTGTAVTVTASELVSGSQTVTENDTYDVTNLATLVVNVSGGGGNPLRIGDAQATLSSAGSSISFTSLSGNPTSFVVMASGDLATGASPYKVATVVFDGSDLHAQTITNTSNAQVTYDGSSFSKSYSNGTLTITSTGAYFQATTYYLTYSYDGGTIDTQDVQVGSGATSITFTDIEDEPTYWSLIFKSNFGTSSGYQRVISVVNDGSTIVGQDMDSSAHFAQNWTASYSNGSLTITSSGTNAGGYFHQPGYYQLTYAIDSGGGNYQTKSVSYTPSTSQQTATITADSQYDALKKVNITVGAMPTMTLPSSASATSSGTSKATITPTSSAQYLNIPTGYNGTAQYYTIAASGGGTSKNVQVSQSTTRNSASSLTKANGDLTVSKTGTYDVYWTASRSNTSTSYTWGSQLYVGGSAYGSENTTWSNNVQNNHLSNVSLTANQKIAVYTRGRSGNYYTYAPMLLIIEN